MTIQKEKNLGEGEALAATALAVEDFEEASNAFLALKRKNKLLAREIALKILHERIGDVFYRALAFEVLYSVALSDAVAYIESDAGTENAYVLRSMIESVTEDAGAITSRDEIQKAVLLLRKALMVRSPDDLSSIAIQRTQFEEAYRSR